MVSKIPDVSAVVIFCKSVPCEGTGPNFQSITGEQIQKGTAILGQQQMIPAIPNSGQSAQLQAGVVNTDTGPNFQSITGEQIQKAKPTPGLKEKLPVKPESGQSVQPQPQQATVPPDYRVKVQFHSITIHDDEEPAPFDDGEYTMRAVVNGMYVDLDKGSGGKLWDVSPGETVYFAPYTYAIIEIPRDFPISIYTLGYEADPCPRIGYGDVVTSDPRIIPILKGPEYEWLGDIRRIIDQDIKVHTTGDYSCNDRIGFINRIDTSYGAGVIHHAKSTNADDPDNPNAKPNFTLRYSSVAQLIPK